MENRQTLTEIARELGLRPGQVAATAELLDAANTIPFIARYRKEATGSLDEMQLRAIAERLEQRRALEARRATVLAQIESQGQLTAELRGKLEAATTLTTLEDLYQPYRPRRRTRASVARERGLAPLAELIVQQEKTRQSLAALAQPFLNEAVATVEEAWAGARDIVAEMVSDHPEVRGQTREKALRWAVLRAEKREKAKDERGVFHQYYAFELGVDQLR
ncbi:MAG: Tex-like N-terminal domain-containing protein, partial [Anaerolineae bacterium]|nr:Tex-like N-terminal domain-containing protein [Anaerolineae bacterium]